MIDGIIPRPYPMLVYNMQIFLQAISEEPCHMDGFDGTMHYYIHNNTWQPLTSVALNIYNYILSNCVSRCLPPCWLIVPSEGNMNTSSAGTAQHHKCHHVLKNTFNVLVNENRNRQLVLHCHAIVGSMVICVLPWILHAKVFSPSQIYF